MDAAPENRVISSAIESSFVVGSGYLDTPYLGPQQPLLKALADLTVQIRIGQKAISKRPESLVSGGTPGAETANALARRDPGAQQRQGAGAEGGQRV